MCLVDGPVRQGLQTIPRINSYRVPLDSFREVEEHPGKPRWSFRGVMIFTFAQRLLGNLALILLGSVVARREHRYLLRWFMGNCKDIHAKILSSLPLAWQANDRDAM